MTKCYDSYKQASSERERGEKEKIAAERHLLAYS
jgi:hypothetical protein